MPSEAKIQGMGSILHEKGVVFRVWVPHGNAVSVIGTFNQWAPHKHPLESEGNGYWYGNVPHAKPGDHYRFNLDSVLIFSR